MQNFRSLFRMTITAGLLFYSSFARAQFCDSVTPTFNVDLSSNPNLNWTSPLVQRDGNCCGTTNPDKCLEFVITLHPNSTSVNFEISSGAVPPGALFYQIDCGPQIAVGSPICLTGPGPFHLTFCKPGNNTNTFTITSYPEPSFGPDINLGVGCSNFIYAQFYDETTVNWTSIAPGFSGQYDNYLSCPSGCDTTFVQAVGAFPNYVDYQVCGMDINGCIAGAICDTIRVSFDPPYTVQIIETQSIQCNGDNNAIVEAQVSGGIGPFTYLWSTGDTTSSISSGAGNVSVQVWDNSSCSPIIANYLITEPTALQLSFSAVPPSCYGYQNGAISSIVSGGTSPYSYLWSNLAVSSNIYDLGTGWYSLTVTDSANCMISDSVYLTNPPELTATISADTTICPGDNANIQVQANGGTGTYTYNWNPVAPNAASIVVSPSANQMYTCVVSDNNGCTASDSMTVSLNLLLPSDLSAMANPYQICLGDSTSISAAYTGSDPSVTLQWMHCPLCPTNTALIERPVISTNYIISAVNYCMDTLYDTVQVVVNQAPVISLNPTNFEGCPNSSFLFQNLAANDPNWDYYWDFGDGNRSYQMAPEHLYSQAGTYPVSLQITDENGCASNNFGNLSVLIHPGAIADFDLNVLDNEQESQDFSLLNYSQNASQFFWTFGDGNSSTAVEPEHEYENSGSFVIQLVANNIYGCSDSIIRFITIKPSWDLFVPNAFTPDGDGSNETFYATGYGISDKDYTLTIFDRWGTIIFVSHDINRGWDGTFKGGTERHQDGVYTWVVHFKDLMDKKHMREGHVSLLK